MKTLPIYLCLAFVSLAALLWADDVVRYDPAAAVPNQVVQVSTSVPTSTALAIPNALIHHSPLSNIPAPQQLANRDSLPPLPIKYWKVVGNDVVEMSAGEKATMDAAEAAAATAANATKKQAVKDWAAAIIAGGYASEPGDMVLIAFLEAYRKREGLTRNQILNALSDEIDLLLP